MSDHCGDGCPFRGCSECRYGGGETPAAATESAPVSGVACETIEAAPGVASTNTKGLTTQTGLES